MIEKKTGKLTTRMFVLMAVSAVAALGCMFFLYESRFLAYQILMERGVVKDGRDEYISWIFQEAPKYDLEPTGHVPEEEREMVDREYLPFLFEHRDPYIGFSIYREDTGKYVTSYLPEILDNEYFSTWIWQDSNMLAAQDERVETYIQFKDCTACMLVENYRIMKIMPLYMGGCLLFCVALFLIPVLVFVHRRMAYLGKVRAQMLVMAEGDLEHPITAEGKDEMAALAGELDYLRQALRENIEKERQSHLANQELIRAMSHDLRTPLTTLYGYLEILANAKGNPMEYPEYIRRCLRKTEEIRKMSDKMFEYALVFENQGDIKKQLLPMESLEKELEEQTEFLRMQGFAVEVMPACRKEEFQGEFYGNAFLLKRLVNNLFSNILRYADIAAPVELTVQRSAQKLTVNLRNTVCKEKEAEGSGVGLKSAKRIVLLHGGEFFQEEKDGFFTVSFWIPVEV